MNNFVIFADSGSFLKTAADIFPGASITSDVKGIEKCLKRECVNILLIDDLASADNCLYVLKEASLFPARVHPYQIAISDGSVLYDNAVIDEPVTYFSELVK